MRTVYQPLTRYTAIANGSSFAAFLCHPALPSCSSGSSAGTHARFAAETLQWSCSWMGRVGRRGDEGMGWCRKDQSGSKGTLSSEHSWRVLILSAPMPRLTRDHCSEEQEMLPFPGLAEGIHLSQRLQAQLVGVKFRVFRKFEGRSSSSELVPNVGETRLHGKVDVKRSQLWPRGILSWRRFSAWFTQSCALQGNHKEERDEDSPEDSFWEQKEVLGAEVPPESLGMPLQYTQIVQTASSRTAFSIFPTTFFLRMVKLYKLGNGFGLFLGTIFF